MQNHATVDIEGFMTKKPVVATTKTGKTVANFSVAVNYGTREEKKANFFNIEAWEKVATIAVKANKGDRVIITGSLKQKTWKTAEGQPRSAIVAVAQEIRIIPKMTVTPAVEAAKKVVTKTK